MVWKPQQYLEFPDHRLRPCDRPFDAHSGVFVRTVVNLGAGAGDVTRLIEEGSLTLMFSQSSVSAKGLRQAARQRPGWNGCSRI